ncbi:MAG: two-component system, NarL family, nitrate/nitrite response regulator NarL [Pseudomonadota bacterium]|jgi:two-component system nitrate/nitrite response regulator NarL|nr:two-component system, NarL family, nitrate/nitrite response regulator NarL [Pseudomonadota bacterium]
MTQPIRVLIVDDHTLFRSGIKALLQRQEDFEVVGEAGDGLEGLKRAKSLQPDVVLLDLHMPGIGGREAVKLLAEEVPACNVLLLTVSEDAEDLMETIRAGARGYLLKNIETDFLLNAIRSAARGESVVSPQMTGKLLMGVRMGTGKEGAAQEGDKEKLSPREKDIIALLAKGVSNKEMAHKLNVAESTIKIHVQNILKKLHLTSRVQAAVYAVEHGLVQKD